MKNKKLDLPTIEDTVHALNETIKSYNLDKIQYTIALGKDSNGKELIYIYSEKEIDLMIDTLDGYKVVNKVVGKIEVVT